MRACVSSAATFGKREDVRGFYLELVRKIESGKQMGLGDMKRFLLSCGHAESADERAYHAQMALRLLRRLRLQRCHFQIFTPFPAEFSGLLFRACIRSGDAQKGTRMERHQCSRNENQRSTT